MSTNPFTRENIATFEPGQIKQAENLLSRVAKADSTYMVQAAYATHAAIVAGVPNKRIAEVLDRSPSLVTLYRRGGSYLMKGGDPESAQWRLLIRKSKINDKRISAVLEEVDSTVEQVHAALAEHFTPDGKPVVAKVSTPSPDNSTGSSVPAPEECAALVSRLDHLIPSLDAEQWAKVETDLNAVIAKAVKARVAAAKAETKAAKVDVAA